MPQIIAVVNQKGGVGKTTTAVNLAASLAGPKSPVLLVDLDPQGNATSGLGGAPTGAGDGVHRLLTEGAQSAAGLAELTVPTSVAGLRLLPSGPDLYAIDLELAQDREHAYFRLRARLQAAAGAFDLVLIDCPPSLGTLTLNGLCAAGSVLVPVQCEYYALEGLTQLLRTIEMVRGAFHEGLRLEGIVLTLFDVRNSLAREVAQEVRRAFPGRVYRQHIPRDVRLSEAPGHRLPIETYAPLSRGAASYRQLAREFRRGPGGAARRPRRPSPATTRSPRATL